MSEVNAKRCEGPCGRVKLLKEFQEHRPGERRSRCRACYNEARRGKTHGGTRPGAQPHVRQERLEAIVEHRLKQENRELRSKNEDLARQLAENSEWNDIIRAARSATLQRPSIHPRERKSKLREGTPLVLASDWHVEEEVKPERVAFRNKYNLEIAAQRMQRFFEAFRWGVRQQRDTFKIRDAILWLGGDFITNFLHEDDVENNLLPPLKALEFFQTNLYKGLYFLLEDPEIEQYLIPMNDGNHPRLTKKLRHATRVDHALEVFLYAQVVMHFKNEPRFKFVMPESQYTFLDDVYGRTIRFLHGDVFQYQGGVGGLTVPLLRAVPRWESVKKADLTCMGHWHQRINLPNIMVNGSLIGYNSFAMSKGFTFEPPSQSLRMLDPLRWCGADIPLWVSKREDDIMTRDK